MFPAVCPACTASVNIRRLSRERDVATRSCSISNSEPVLETLFRSFLIYFAAYKLHCDCMYPSCAFCSYHQHSVSRAEKNGQQSTNCMEATALPRMSQDCLPWNESIFALRDCPVKFGNHQGPRRRSSQEKIRLAVSDFL